MNIGKVVVKRHCRVEATVLGGETLDGCDVFGPHIFSEGPPFLANHGVRAGAGGLALDGQPSGEGGKREKSEELHSESSEGEGESEWGGESEVIMRECQER